MRPLLAIPVILAPIFALAGCGGAASDDGSGTGMNLRITGASFASSPGAPVKGNPATVTMEVLNNGTAATPATTFSYTLDGTTATAALPSVPAGGSLDVVFAVTSATAGTFAVAVVLDPANAVNERSEADNSASVSITWSETSLRNIAISAAVLDDATLAIGDDARLTYTLTYTNIISGTVPVTWRIVRDDDGTLTQVASGAHTVTIGTPLPIATTFDDPGISGARAYILQVDYNDTVAESSEDDNRFAFTITWSASG